jgi:hypothetical protein
LLKAIILTGAVAVALVVYFSLSLYVFPQSYQSIEPRRPQAIVNDVNLSAPTITLGQALIISVTGTNNGEDAADMQLVSVGFPNLTSVDNIKILKHNFTQTPMLITPGKLLSSQYSSTGESVLPKTEGKFVVFIKSVALPHTWDRAHYPQDGTLDQQKEFVGTYSVQVTKP